MQLTFLGTGGGLPSPKRGVSAIAVQIGREIVLFDCGEGTQRQFMLSSNSYMKVNKIFITHFHGDHFLGLPGLLQSMNFNGRTKPLQIYGPEGMIGIVRSCVQLGYFDPGFPIYAGELAHNDVVDFGPFKVTAIMADHSVPALAYVLEEKERKGRFLPNKAKEYGIKEGPMFSHLQEGQSVKVGSRTITPDMVMGFPRRGRKIVFSGDTRPMETIIKASHEADVLIHEATMDESLEEGAHQYGHSTAKDAASLADKANVGMLYLTHISNRYEDGQILEAEAKRIFPRTRIAEDFLTIVVKLRD